MNADLNADFIAQLNGLSGHARARREGLEKLFPDPAPIPKLFGVIGHLGGYGEFPATGLGGASGYGLRPCLAGQRPEAGRRGRRRSTRAAP